jgi:hypothetical protein
MFLLVIIGVLTYLFSHVILTHVIIERRDLTCLSQRLKLIYLCSYLHADTCMMWSQVKSIFGEDKSAEFTVVVF